MLPVKYDLPVYRGDTFRRIVRLRTVNDDGSLGAYADLTGCTALAQIRLRETSTTALQVFAANVLDQTTDLGSVQISLTATQTADLPDLSRWDFQLTHPNGDVHTYLAGKVSVSGQTSRP